MACQALGLCSSGGRLAAVRYGHADGLVHVHIDAAIFESGLCDICESIMSQLEGMLDSHATKVSVHSPCVLFGIVLAFHQCHVMTISISAAIVA